MDHVAQTVGDNTCLCFPSNLHNFLRDTFSSRAVVIFLRLHNQFEYVMVHLNILSRYISTRAQKMTYSCNSASTKQIGFICVGVRLFVF